MTRPLAQHALRVVTFVAVCALLAPTFAFARGHGGHGHGGHGRGPGGGHGHGRHAWTLCRAACPEQKP